MDVNATPTGNVCFLWWFCFWFPLKAQRRMSFAPPWKSLPTFNQHCHHSEKEGGANVPERFAMSLQWRREIHLDSRCLLISLFQVGLKGNAPESQLAFLLFSTSSVFHLVPLLFRIPQDLLLGRNMKQLSNLRFRKFNIWTWQTKRARERIPPDIKLP